MSDQSQGPGWWVASDGKWYPPQAPTAGQPTAPFPSSPAGAPMPSGQMPGGPMPGPQMGGPQPPAKKSSLGLVIALVALVVLLLTGGLVFALTRPKNDTAAPTASSTTAPASSSSSTTTADGGKDKENTSTTRGKTSTTSSSDKTANFPPPKDPAGAIQAAGLPELDAEGSLVHYHAHLDVIVNGKPVTVAAQIGIARTTISPMHTHDKTGVVHIEADEDAQFTTQQFFTEWEVKLDKDCIGDFCADRDHELKGFLNGQAVDDPSAIVFGEHDEVVIWYGSTGDSADVPATFDFPDGL